MNCRTSSPAEVSSNLPPLQVLLADISCRRLRLKQGDAVHHDIGMTMSHERPPTPARAACFQRSVSMCRSLTRSWIDAESISLKDMISLCPPPQRPGWQDELRWSLGSNVPILLSADNIEPGGPLIFKGTCHAWRTRTRDCLSTWSYVIRGTLGRPATLDDVWRRGFKSHARIALTCIGAPNSWEGSKSWRSPGCSK